MTKDNVAVIGSGGREHALAWKLAQSEDVRTRDGAAATIVMASQGYPTNPQTGFTIAGLDDPELDTYSANAKIFFAGVTKEAGSLLASGGRVLSVTATGKDISDAVETAYEIVDPLADATTSANPGRDTFFYRTDIAHQALRTY